MLSLLKNMDLSLGIPKLLPQWKQLFSKRYFNADLMAGITVALVAIPLSLAIALASGMPPATGLVTAIVAGIVCSLFGGTPLSVSGPAAAMTILIADNVETFGIEALAILCLTAGLMQLLSGMLGIGKLAKYVPLPVIAGFTAGIGVIIIVGQLPRAFGLTPPAESHIFDVFNHIKLYFHEINGESLFIVVVTLVIIRGLPKIFPKAPAILIAVIVSSMIVYFLKLTDIPLIGKIPNTLPKPKMPSLSGITIEEILWNGFTIYLLASLETLLSATAIDKLTGKDKHDSNQELIGQGIGNLAVSLFNGIPVTGVIARSMTNVRAGAKTRRASIIHALIILLAVFALAPLISLIPIAALAGVLFSIAFSMVNVKEFYGLWIISRGEGLIYAVTFLTIIFVDLVAGVQVGMIAAAFIVLLNAAKTNFHISTFSDDQITRLSLKGSLTFLSTGKIAELEKSLNTSQAGSTVILDVSHITNLDTSGAAAIVDLFNRCRELKIKFYLKGLSRKFERLFRVCEGDKIIDQHYLVSESELKKESLDTYYSDRGRLLHGVQQFYAERLENDKRLFENIAKKQDPNTLFITCSDSRVVPSLITSSDPGELFIIRNVGNFIPPYHPNMLSSEAAAIEFALNYLHITDIVVCGHSGCGAIRACCENEPLPNELSAWINMIRHQLKPSHSPEVNKLARINVLNQIENLKQYPIVKEKIANRYLTIHAWFFDVENMLMYEWDLNDQDFKSIVTT